MSFERWWRVLQLRLRSLVHRAHADRELDEELQFHVDQQIAHNIERGMTAAEARTAALRALGGAQQCKEACHDTRRVNTVEHVAQDIRHAVRRLWQTPSFTLVATLVLALGTGANTAVFELVEAVAFRVLPVANPRELVEIRVVGGNRGMGLSGDSNSQLTYPLWTTIREHQEALASTFAWGTAEFLLGRGADAQAVKGLWVSGDLFPVLGIRPAQGRLLAASDDRPGCAPDAAVVSDGFWQSQLGGQASAIGRSLDIGNATFHIVGVTPPEFYGLEVGSSFDVALPLCAEPAVHGTPLERRDVWWLTMMGRLKPDWTLARAAAHVDALSPAVFEATAPPGRQASSDALYRSFRLTAVSAAHGVSQLRTSYGAALWLLFGMTGLVLLIACANLASLFLVRASAREREMAVRVALGAARGRLISQVLMESLLLALVGAAAGAVVAGWLAATLMTFLNANATIELRTDWPVLMFTSLVAVTTCMTFGVVPAIRAGRVPPRAAMQTGGRSMSQGTHQFSVQRLLVIGQVAISLVLLVGALLFVATFRNLVTVDTGFQRSGLILAMFADFAHVKWPDEQRLAFQTQLLADVRSLPRRCRSRHLDAHATQRQQLDAGCSDAASRRRTGQWKVHVRQPRVLRHDGDCAAGGT